MSTVNKEIADRIIAGEWPEDEAEQIVEYENAWGSKSYGVTFRGGDVDKYLTTSPYVRNPTIYWKRGA